MRVVPEDAGWSRPVLLLMLTMISIPSDVHGLLTEGLYVSNKTDILFISNPESSSGSVSSAYKQVGRIVGLAYDKNSDHLFWSNIDVINRGIYRGSLNAEGKVDNVTKIIETDILEVNSLSFDWVSKHLYWTDSRKKTIEVSDADGSNRRILMMTGQGSPRGIYADPIHGYLFWTDQGHRHIARSQLDGSDQRIIVAQGVNLPNQIVVYNNKLYWVDSNNKTFESSDLDGGQRKSTSVTLASGQHIFGLAIHDNRAYITNWVNGQLVVIDTNGNNVAKGTQNLGSEIFSAIYAKASYQPQRADPCAAKGCAALCLPVRATETRCACPSYGGKTLNDADGKTCINPKNSIFLVAMADSGYVGFFDPSSKFKKDFYIVGRSLRPVAVAYDPVTKNVFWSDVRERTVHLANIDGTNHQILLRGKNGVGLVEGMLVDADRRQLYYTNIGSVYIDATPYSWHRVETISLQDLTNVKVKTIVTTADKPRGLALDSQNGHLYYTDWGNRASIVRVDLDGSNPTLIRTGLDNPNGIAVLNNKIFFVDSHFKTRQPQDDLHRPTQKNGSLYSMNLDGSGFRDVLAQTGVKLRTPFGLTATPSGLYVGDWETEALTLLNLDGTLSDTIVQGTSGLMSLSYSPFTTNAGSISCAGRNCGDICLSKTTTVKSCTCNSYGGKSLDDNGASCSVPSKFMIVADMNSIKLVSLDGKDSNSYIAVQGNPFFSNFVGLAYNDASRTVYYSDAYRKTINALNLSNMTTTVLYRINEVIDGMVYHSENLYWTDYTNGRICRLSLRPPSGGELRHETLVRNLKRPRGIRLHNNAIYWTEWGETPKISKKELNSIRNEPLFGSLELVWPNGISIEGNHLYVADASTKKIFRCSLNGNDDCQPIGGNEEVLKHAYDLWTTDGRVFYYSDWKTGAVNAFSIDKPGKTWTVVGGLMRPTQFYISSPSSSRPTCPAGTCSGGSCVPLWVNHGCDCQNKVPTYDLKNCTSVSTTGCTYDGKSNEPGTSFSPAPCLNCRCLGTFSWANDPVYNNSVCERITCPKLNCAPGEVQRSPSKCCPTCKECGIRITNCPDESVRRILPYNQGFVVYDFLPTVQDCLGLAREVSTERSPLGAIYRRGTTDVTLISSAKRKNGDGVDKAECKIKVVVEDKTSPTITCPGDVNAYLIGEQTSVEVKWSPPEVFDNDEIEGRPEASIAWGSSFGEGTHTVKYTVKDKSGLSSECSFEVKVVKLKTTQQINCKIPQIDNGQLRCTSGNNALQCRLENCHSQYKLVKSWESICTNGRWILEAPLQGACIKQTPASVKGSLKIAVPASEACPEGTGLIDHEYTRDFLQDAIRRDHLIQSSVLLNSIVKVEGCLTPWDPLVVKVDLAGRSSEPENLTIEVNAILKDIRTALDREFMRVLVKDQKGTRTAHNLSITITDATIGCLPGQIDEGSGTCETCGVGTYHVNNTCVKCLPDFYNDVEGQTKCTACPTGAKSGTGSYIINQCIHVSDHFMLIIALAACFGLLLLILLVIVIVCARRRSASKRLALQSNDPQLNMNKCFNPDLDYDCTYDKIAEPTVEIPTGSKNQYEKLETSGGATENNYDSIDNSLLGAGSTGAAEGNSPDEDGKSTPPYLQPINA